MLGKMVNVIIDRPIHSVHPKEKDVVYEVNYGYIPHTLSEIDKEEIDAYVLGVEEPIQTFYGKVIAIIHRNQEEDKLIVANQNFSKKEIWEKVYFMERYFSSHIEMAMTTKEDLLFDLTRLSFTSKDVVLLHSSLKSFGAIHGQDILDAFKDFFYDGMVILPTHSWNTITKNGDHFYVKTTPSCVGALTNLALQDPMFKRSMHPTHSVCAFGKNRDSYLALDLNQKTPVSKTGCFGSLKNYHAKILFMGAPLSKNTFIHSIEEEMGVPDRFTQEIYEFYSSNENETITYHMPRHFSTKRPHLSENYAKLLPHFLTRGIAYIDYIGNSQTIILDAAKCYQYVKKLLEKNLHLFDDDKEYDDE